MQELQNAPFVDYILADNPDDLKAQLRQIKLPYKLMFAIPYGGGRILAFVNPTQPLNKSRLTKPLTEIEEGTTTEVPSSTKKKTVRKKTRSK